MNRLQFERWSVIKSSRLRRLSEYSTMSSNFEKDYNNIRSGGSGFYVQKRGLIAVWGKEAVQFLDGLISNDMKTLEDGEQMLAAFPNAQGRLLAVVRVLRQGDRFLFETEGATREKVFDNLFRFTYAGDFFVEDLSEQYRYFELFGFGAEPSLTVRLLIQAEPPALAGGVTFTSNKTSGYFTLSDNGDNFRSNLIVASGVEISDELYEVLRIESGIPKYGVDMDETTIVPELGIGGLISYKKGCYIGQEIIARIHFRGHVAKQLTGLILSKPPAVATGLLPGTELKTADGKNAGRVTSVTFSPKLGKTIALAYVRYDYLAEGTELNAHDKKVTVTHLPFIN
jgi:folate-binding protein YgfZ